MTFFDKTVGCAMGLWLAVVAVGGIWSLGQIIAAIIAAPMLCAQMVFALLVLYWVLRSFDYR